MMRIMLLVLVAICSIACQSSYAASMGEHNVHISVDDKSLERVNQVVFGFDKDIAIVGAIPSQAQLRFFSIGKTVKTDERYNAQCQWRFIDTRRLACELKKPLMSASIYQLKVDAGFEFIDGTVLKTSYSKQVTTPYPQWEISPLDHPEDHFAWRFFFYSFNNPVARQQFGHLNQFLQLRLPSNEVFDVTSEWVLEDNDYGVRLTLLLTDEQRRFHQQGLYQLEVKPGIRLPHADYQSKQPMVLHKQYIYHDFRWLGFNCSLKSDFHALEMMVDQPLDCPPHEIAMVFSRPANVENVAGWFTGEKPARKSNYQKSVDGLYYLKLNLLGERPYQIDLNKITDKNGKPLSHQLMLDFTTEPSSPLLGKMGNGIYESGEPIKPKLFAQSVYSAQAVFETMGTALQLQRWLNGDLTPSEPDKVAFDYDRPSDLKAFPLPYQKLLGQSSGLIHAQYVAASELAKAEPATALISQSLSNIAGFNLSYWLGAESMVYASDWQYQQPMAEVEVSLLCKGFEQPFLLGRTSGDGIVRFSGELLRQSELLEGNCYFWGDTAQSGKGGTGILTAALPISSDEISGVRRQLDVSVQGWSSQPVYQPGSQVNLGFVARKRSDEGVSSVVDFSDYQLSLTGPDYSLVQTFSLSNLTRFGFGTLQFDTTGFAPGDYRLKVSRITDVLKELDYAHTVVDFAIEHFTLPEFEVALTGSKVVQKGEKVDLLTTVMRLNGVALEGAKVDIEPRVTQRSYFFENWPKDYQWVRPVNTAKNKQFKGKSLIIDKSAKVQWQSDAIDLDFALASVDIGVIVTARDGEVQRHSHHADYFGRDHFVGLKIHDDKSTIDLVGVNQQGKLVDIPNVKARFIRFVQSIPQIGEMPKPATKKLLKTCDISQLPASCQLPKRINKSFTLEIEVAGHLSEYVFHPHQLKPPKQSILAANNNRDIYFDFDDANYLFKVDEKAQIELTSPIATEARFVLFAGKIKRTWKQKLVKGTNTIEFALNHAMMPQATLHASVLLPRGEHVAARWGLNKMRLLSDSVIFTVLSNLPELSVETELQQTEFISGEQISMAVRANADVDSQSWLVNEALWQLLNVTEQSYDMSAFLGLTSSQLSYSWENMTFNSLISRLHKASDLMVMEKIAVAGSSLYRRGEDRDRGASLSALGESGSKTNVEANFAPSVWLPLLALKAEQSQSLSLTLPKVPGRFKLVTIAGNSQQINLDVKTITTRLPQEFFVDAPKQMRQTDEAKLLITAINRQQSDISSELELLLDGQQVKRLTMKLSAEQQKTKQIQLPAMGVGKHRYQLIHPRFGVVAQHDITVTPAHYSNKRNWLFGPSQDTNILLSESAKQVQLKMSPVASQAPIWPEQMAYVKAYPHKCWEQTLSRAVSYAYTPQNLELWPQGKEVFATLLADVSQFQYRGRFGYFGHDDSSGFLTAYTYLAATWLAAKGIHLAVELEPFEDQVMATLTNATASSSERSMALAGLTYAGQLSVQQVVELRQSIGASTGFAQALQLLAMRKVGVAEPLLTQATEHLISHGYQDNSISVLSGNAQRCFAALALDPQHPVRAQLIATVQQSQWQQGDFGSTFAAGVCSYLMTDMQGTNPAPIEVDFEPVELSEPVEMQAKGQQGYRFSRDLPDVRANQQSGDYWLQAQYVVPFGSIEPQQQGFAVQRQYYLYQHHQKPQNQFKPLTANDTLAIGDVVKVKLIVDSRADYEQATVIDFVPGAFEVVNSKFANQVFESDLGINNNNRYHKSWFVHKDISENSVRYYPHFLSKGKQVFSYLVKVRYSGQFVAPPARVELMYNHEVRGNTDASTINVK